MYTMPFILCKLQQQPMSMQSRLLPLQQPMSPLPQFLLNLSKRSLLCILSIILQPNQQLLLRSLLSILYTLNLHKLSKQLFRIRNQLFPMQSILHILHRKHLPMWCRFIPILKPMLKLSLHLCNMFIQHRLSILLRQLPFSKSILLSSRVLKL